MDNIEKTNNAPEIIDVAPEDDFISKELTKYNLTDAKIAEMRQSYTALKVNDPQDVAN